MRTWEKCGFNRQGSLQLTEVLSNWRRFAQKGWKKPMGMRSAPPAGRGCDNISSRARADGGAAGEPDPTQDTLAALRGARPHSRGACGRRRSRSPESLSKGFDLETVDESRAHAKFADNKPPSGSARRQGERLRKLRAATDAYRSSIRFRDPGLWTRYPRPDRSLLAKRAARKSEAIHDF